MADLIGQQLGDYQLLRRLGSGTFGEVYEGEQIYLKTHAAVKVLHAQLDQAEFQRFVEEARTIAALEHPHIVRVVNFSIHQSTPYLVMQLAQGSLKDRFALGQLQPIEAILPYLRQAAEGLQHAHDQHMMHLDIKPANLLLTLQNQVLLADFGLATVLQTQRTHQTLHGFAGTPGYAAPEQFQNKPGLASDQYALGVMVYQWLTGMLPFEGDWWAIGHQKLTQDPPSLHAQASGISSAVEDVVLRVLSKDPSQRFLSVQDFAEALEAASRMTQQQHTSPFLPSRPPELSTGVSPTRTVLPKRPSSQGTKLQRRGGRLRQLSNVLLPLLLGGVTFLFILPFVMNNRAYLSVSGSFPPGLILLAVGVVLLIFAVVQGIALSYAGSENVLWSLGMLGGFSLFLLTGCLAIFGPLPSVILLVALGFLGYRLARLIRPTPEGQVDIVEAFGKHSRTLLPGLNLIAPWEKIVSKLDTRERVWSYPIQKVSNSRSQEVQLAATISYHLLPEDAHLAALNVANWEKSLRALFTATVQQSLSELQPEDFNAHLLGARKERSDQKPLQWERTANQIKQTMQEQVASWGVEVKWVHIQQTREVT